MIPAPLLLEGYRRGFFPMAVDGGAIQWFSPDPRGILPLETFHVPRRLARDLKRRRFEIRIDRAFEAVIHACASREDSDGNWISQEIIDSYLALSRLGFAHSVETWENDRLVGGLYGVAIGGAFFGESMFHRVTGASKAALVALVERLRARDYALLDVQWLTSHLASFGGIEIPRRQYLALLEASLARDCLFVDRPVTGAASA